MEIKKEERLQELRPKIEQSIFWKDVKIAPLATTSVAPVTPATTTTTPDATKAKEEKQILVPFPKKSAMVYHFHPIAFVEQMRMINDLLDIDLSDPDKWMSQFDNPITYIFSFGRNIPLVL